MNQGTEDHELLNASARIPVATYRIQFNRQFNFRQALEIVDYLRDLGISDGYASPLFRAGPQSTHGYDICGFEAFSPQLGTMEEFIQFSDRLRSLGLGLLLDMVPNHMGADLSNEWWLDVLEKGQTSRYSGWFDIDWRPIKSDLRDQVLLPTLEDHYGRVLEAGKLKLGFHKGHFGLTYYDRSFPLSARSYPHIWRAILECLPTSPAGAKVKGELGMWLANGPAPFNPEERQAQLRRWHEMSLEFRHALQAALEQINGQPGTPDSFDRLHAIIREQHYRLAYWRVGSEEINYRRFFDVTDLVSLRMELPEVFEATHRLIFQRVREGRVTGLRIDHPDGLWDPQQYLVRLQQHGAKELAAVNPSAPQEALYIVAEKILSGPEPLPADWPVHGTTGYDFLNQVNGLFVDSRAEAKLEALYRKYTEDGADFHSLVYASKKKILETSLVSELNALTHRLKAIATQTRQGMDMTFRQLHSVLAELIAAFPVYRTYVTETSLGLSALESEQIAEAVARVRTFAPSLEPAALEFVEGLLRLNVPADLDAEGQQRCRQFVMRFQQLTGPVMAKGLEDTAFYNYNRLISLNEVGGEPNRFAVSVEAFHDYNLRQAEHWPHSLLATATHDTKRGEDVRARLNVLSEMPEPWREAVTRWTRLNESKKPLVNGEPAPRPNDEYLLYQTLVGAWPDDGHTESGLKGFADRVCAYMSKAMKEAKTRTNWTNPNVDYEKAVLSFAGQLLVPGANPFLEDFFPLQRRAAFFGRFNSLSQTLLKLTSPGVPDFYQGTELWDLSLVDPDNRRPVDYSLRRRLLEKLKGEFGEAAAGLDAFFKRLLESDSSGEAKLFLIWRGLQFRLQNRALFELGNYVALSASGSRREHVCAFARTHGDSTCITVVPRLVLSLAGQEDRPPMGGGVWGDTRLGLASLREGTRLRNVLTEEVLATTLSGGSLPMAEVLARFPVALLEKVNER
jgi:(1->4)-alpha-D-glucan 1-alpha-D-glucosylmutase